MVKIVDLQRNWRAQGHAAHHAAQDMCLVPLDLHARAGAGVRLPAPYQTLPARQIRIDVPWLQR